VVDCDTLEIALAVADDLSRWAKRDPNTRNADPNVLAKQLGDDLLYWANNICNGKMKFVPFRQWRDEQEAIATGRYVPDRSTP
jgi:hypothetical protein